jgi:hypothetical protein
MLESQWIEVPDDAVLDVPTRDASCSSQRHDKNPAPFWPETISPIAGLDPNQHSLPLAKPAVLKCICAGSEVPFYCPRHGQVENPNWPPLMAAAGAE